MVTCQKIDPVYNFTTRNSVLNYLVHIIRSMQKNPVNDSIINAPTASVHGCGQPGLASESAYIVMTTYATGFVVHGQSYKD